MEVDRFLVYLAFLGPAVVVALYVRELMRGEVSDVRDAWMHVVPQAFALVASLGALLASRTSAQNGAAAGLAGAGLTALFVHGVLVVALPLREDEASLAKLWPTMDLVGWFTFAALAYARSTGRSLHETSRRLLQALALALLVRLLFQVALVPTPWRVAGAALGAIALALGVAVAASERVSRPATPG